MYILGYLQTPNQWKKKKKPICLQLYLLRHVNEDMKENKHLHSQTILRKVFTPVF